ncbi:hypothetical protein D5266_03105 [bacterium c-19]|nr:hypothetical protein [bacterium c-19]
MKQVFLYKKSKGASFRSDIHTLMRSPFQKKGSKISEKILIFLLPLFKIILSVFLHKIIK